MRAPIQPYETYYRLAMDALEFQLLYKEIGIRKAVYCIDSKGKECASIYVDENIEEPENNTVELLLSKVIYKPQCVIGHSMARGEPTIKMLRALLSFAIKMIPKYPYIVFMDDSHIDCKLPGMNIKKEISLANLEFFLSGKTWYEKHFNATIDEGDMLRRQKLDAANELLNSPINESTFDNFWTSALRLGAMLRNNEWYVKAKDASRELYDTYYEQKKSWRDLFSQLFSNHGTISKTLGENVGCSLFSMMETPLKERFGVPELNQTHWKLKRETIEHYPEYMLEAKINDEPLHVKKSETSQKLLFLSEQGDSLYLVGGKETRKRRIRKMPKGYGGLISFLGHSFATKGSLKLHKGKGCLERLQ